MAGSPRVLPDITLATHRKLSPGSTWLVLIGAVAAACTGIIEGPSASSSARSDAPGPALEPDPAELPEPVLVATPRLARLSRVQWENTVRDLLLLDEIDDIVDLVPGDAVVGLDNDAESLFVGQQRWADFEAAASALAERVTAAPAALARLVPSDAPSDPVARARTWITSFGERAFRRPLASHEIERYLALFEQGSELYPERDPFAAGAQLALTAFLQSPHFLYRAELGASAVDGKVALDPYQIAAKLAYALTNTMPDEALFEKARDGTLASADVVASEVTRLLESEDGAAARDHLHFQIYRLGAYDGISRDSAAFPDFTSDAPAAMREEILLFLRHIFDQGQGIRELFTSNVTFVNSALAPLYELPGTFDTSFTRVDLDPGLRAGLLTRLGFLSSYAVVNDPDTIRRGVFVNQRILCVELPPPDPNALALAPLSADMTNRERVEATTGPGTCGQGCHSSIINPPGFAFEHFDATGKYRSVDRGKPIDAASAYAFADGERRFDGAIEFSQLLAESEQAHSCYVQAWFAHLNGRMPQPEDQPWIAHLAYLSREEQLPIEGLVLRLATHEAFLSRLP